MTLVVKSKAFPVNCQLDNEIVLTIERKQRGFVAINIANIAKYSRRTVTRKAVWLTSQTACSTILAWIVSTRRCLACIARITFQTGTRIVWRCKAKIMFMLDTWNIFSRYFRFCWSIKTISITSDFVAKYSRWATRIWQFRRQVQFKGRIIVNFFVTKNNELAALAAFDILFKYIINNRVNVLINILEQEGKPVFDGKLQLLQEIGREKSFLRIQFSACCCGSIHNRANIQNVLLLLFKI